MAVPAIQERQHSVLTNQCFGKETNAESPGRGTEESFLVDSDKFIVGIRKPDTLWRATLFAGRGPRRHKRHDNMIITPDEMVAADGDASRILPVHTCIWIREGQRRDRDSKSFR